MTKKSNVKPEKIRTICAQIAELEASTNFKNLIAALKVFEDLKFRKSKAATTFATMHGITGKSLLGEEHAVRNWAAKARRTLLRTEG